MGIAIYMLYGCIRDISVELPRPEDKLVVEAYIELDSFAVVFLTKNAAYFDPIDIAELENYIVWGDDAIVTVSDGTTIDTLIPAIFEKYPHKGYIGTQIKGKVFGEYELSIYYDNNEYTSVTRIPDVIEIDSVWYELWIEDQSLGALGFSWQDPPGLGDYYTVSARVEGKQKTFYRPFFSWHVLDDKLEDGRVMEYFPFFRPYDGNAYFGQERDTSLSGIHYILYKIHDTVSLKLSTIDLYTYRFWNSWYRNFVTDGNPFANPATVLTNIEGENVEGYWGGYGSYITTIFIEDSITVIRVD